MKISSVNSCNLARLSNAFIDYFLDNGLLLNKTELVVAGEELALTYEIDGKVNVFRFKKEACIGHELDFFVESVVKPMLNDLKGIKK